MPRTPEGDYQLSLPSFPESKSNPGSTNKEKLPKIVRLPERTTVYWGPPLGESIFPQRRGELPHAVRFAQALTEFDKRTNSVFIYGNVLDITEELKYLHLDRHFWVRRPKIRKGQGPKWDIDPEDR